MIYTVYLPTGSLRACTYSKTPASKSMVSCLPARWKYAQEKKKRDIFLLCSTPQKRSRTSNCQLQHGAILAVLHSGNFAMCLTLSRRQVCCAPAAAPSQPVPLTWQRLQTPFVAPRASSNASPGAGRARSKLHAKSHCIRRLEPCSALAKTPGEPGYTLDISLNIQAPKSGACRTEARL